MRRIRKAAKSNEPPDRRLIGYARVSTEDQDMRRQTDALLRAGVMDVNLYTDKKSGATMRRKGLEHALLDCRPGDVLVAVSVDRLSRSIKDLIWLSERLHSEGVELRILHQNIDTTSAMGRAFFHIMAVMAELERGMIADRTRDGMAAARARGAKFGPEGKIDKKKLLAVAALLKSGVSAEAVGKKFGLTGQRIRQIVLSEYGKPLWKPKPRKQK